MEKTTNIRLSGIRFEVTDSAYRALDDYLKSLATSFEGDPDKAEIIQDIESRIAEKFIESKTDVITLEMVEAMLKQIGTPQSIAAGEDELSTATHPKKLYRDIDNGLVAGVGAGLGAYLGVDPFIVRLMFILIVLVGGSGIVIYILLWLFIPAARTASQKLEMRGSAVTVESVRRHIQNREGKFLNSNFRRLVYLPFELLGAFIRGLRRITPVLKKLVGFVLVTCSFLTLLCITVLATLFLVNMHTPAIGFPEAISSSLLYAVTVAVYFSLAIPFIFLFMLGQKLLSMAPRITPTIGFGLVGVWSLAIITSGAMGFYMVNEYNEYVEASPLYQVSTQEITLGDYESIVIVGDMEVTVSNGPVQRTTITGYAHDVERLSAELNEDTLRLEYETDPDNCIFCDTDEVVVNIVTPDLESITIQQGNLVLENVVLESLEIDASRSHIEGNLEVDSLSLSGSSIEANITGSATVANLKLSSSRFSGLSFAIQDIDIEALYRTTARIWASNTLDSHADEGSRIIHRETPESTEENVDVTF